MSQQPAVRLEFDERRAVLTLSRPPLNVLDLAALAELEAAAGYLEGQDGLQTVVVQGSQRAFSAGVSIHDHTSDKIEPMLGRFHAALRSLDRLDAVTVAAVRGHCLGGGMELASVCDLVVASDDSRFGQPEIDVGCFPPLAAALYPSLLGPRVAADLILTGRLLDAREAHALGFVSRLVPRASFDDALEELLAQLESKSRAALRLTKKALRAGRGPFWQQALAECEKIYLDDLSRTEDLGEGVQAFIEKRSAVWRHR